ncbi:MAG TPA: S8 family serine peptidase [Symbiobacteriaceae bacterium]|nr:S8 family serine peptidase [Symbiobacteriaceae bacterium]
MRFHKWASLLAVLVLFASMPQSTKADSVKTSRVLIRASVEERKRLEDRYGLRHDFGDLGFTVEIPEVDLVPLRERKGIDIAPVQSWAAAPFASRVHASKVGSTSRLLPNTQVPFGIRVVHNDVNRILSGSTPPSGGAGIKVAILDSGIALDHPDFAGTTIYACLDYTGKGKGPKSGCTDTTGHGTYVAGIIASRGGMDGLGLYGVAPDAAIGVYKVCNQACSTDDIAAAVYQAVNDGASIINISIGSNIPDPLTRAAIERAWQYGVLIVSSAGNDGPTPGSLDYPSAYPQVVAVGSVYPMISDDISAANLVVHETSSRGQVGSTGSDGIQEGEPDVVAPGVGVLSTWPDGAYLLASGTSAAAPHISGLAAIGWQGSASATRSWLQSQALKNDVLTSAEGNGVLLLDQQGYDPASGYGSPRLN